MDVKRWGYFEICAVMYSVFTCGFGAILPFSYEHYFYTDEASAYVPSGDQFVVFQDVGGEVVAKNTPAWRNVVRAGGDKQVAMVVSSKAKGDHDVGAATTPAVVPAAAGTNIIPGGNGT